ncbi:MAG: class I SAM-dependent methyltransferase [Verrucomicrobia bacterium]|nr:class I SAM-dependent methyltransferase [Verrucomicrobiota bacterium]
MDIEKTDFAGTTEHDRKVWDKCASPYEKRIVGGHPDITYAEEFEETLIEKLLLHLARTTDKKLAVVDLGCGSARTLLRYAVQTEDDKALPPAETAKLNAHRIKYVYNHELAGRIEYMVGIDFSAEMLNLAKKKFEDAGIGRLIDTKVKLIEGSAFDPVDLPEDVLPVVVCLINSIGVMQGTEGAEKLFDAVGRTINKNNGVGFISAFCKKFMRSHMLGQYESTLDVAGAPSWLTSDKYDLRTTDCIPMYYKRAYDPTPYIDVAVLDENGAVAEDRHRLQRDPKAVEETLETGKISTWHGYRSNWYSQDRFKEWISKHWGDAGFHVRSAHLDKVRAEAMQMAWCDKTGLCEDWLQSMMNVE